ncbi:MAG: hypothetical protein U5K69_24495 [Balneolaceae bacterium]|nr:hypothetical protein [Balneolaceae bacterium]
MKSLSARVHTLLLLVISGIPNTATSAGGTAGRCQQKPYVLFETMLQSTSNGAIENFIDESMRARERT